MGPCDDATLLEHIKKAIADSRFTGEGYRKIWARLRFSGVRSAPGRVRRLMRQSFDASLDQQLDAERAAFEASTTDTDFDEGLRAFIAKRPPTFQGR